MLQCDRDALLCDFAETYHICSFTGLPVRTLAALASGLRDDSRIKMKMSGTKLSLRDTLAAAILDKLAWIQWAQSKDGQSGENYPRSVLELLLKRDQKENHSGFENAEDYEAEWERQTGVKHGWQ